MTLFGNTDRIAPAFEGARFDARRVVIANRVAVDAFKRGVRSFPDRSALVKLAWKRTPTDEFASATMSGTATRVKIMVKDSKGLAATGRWGFGQVIGGRPVDVDDRAQSPECFGAAFRASGKKWLPDDGGDE